VIVLIAAGVSATGLGRGLTWFLAMSTVWTGGENLVLRPGPGTGREAVAARPERRVPRLVGGRSGLSMLTASATGSPLIRAGGARSDSWTSALRAPNYSLIFIESVMDPHDTPAAVIRSNNGAELDCGPRGPHHRAPGVGGGPQMGLLGGGARAASLRSYVRKYCGLDRT
jgi:hypothetical protein